MAEPKFNADEARALFSSIGQIHLTYIHPNGLKIDGQHFANRIEEAVEGARVANEAGFNVYWTVNLVREGFNGRKPAKADIVAARFAHVDIDPPKTGGAFDKAAIVEGLSQIAAPPSFIIDSGGGLNVYWRLDDDYQGLLQVEAINRQIRDYCGEGADHCWNIDRIMRVPGTVNYPNAQKKARGRSPVLAKFAVEDDGVIYDPLTLSSTFPPENPTAPKGEAVAIAVPANVTPITPDDLQLGPLDPVRLAISEPPGRDRSGDGVAAARLMANAGMSDEQILGVLLNPENAVSAHYLAQRDAKRAAARTIQLIRSDAPSEYERPSDDIQVLSREDFDRFVSNMRAKVKKAMVPAELGGTRESKAKQAAPGDYAWLDDLGDNPIAQFVNHVCATAPSPQPWVTLGAALTVFGTVAGRRYAGPTNLRTNLYAIGICDSGGGKDHPIKMATELMVKAGQQKKMGGSKIASGQAMLTDLSNNPALMYAIDEVGFLIASAADRKRAPKHATEIIDNLTFLYSQAASTFLGTSYADQKEKPRQVIEQPCLSLFGVTTPSVFWGSLSSSNVLDGSLARMVIFQSENDYPDPQYDIERIDMPPRLIAAIEAIVAGAQGHNPLPLGEAAAITPKPYTVPYADAEAALMARTMRDQQTDMLRAHRGTNQTSIIARLAENAAKIALIRAVAENPASPAITRADLEWGLMVARKSVDSLLKAVREQVADNEGEAKLKRLQKIIADAGADGLEHERLYRAARFMGTRRNMNDAIDFLVEGGAVKLVEVKLENAKKPRRIYFAP